METSKVQEGRLLHQILPPRLEDAGLEDCALPPDAIKEAFFKAADAVKSAASLFTSDEDEVAKGDCVDDPLPAAKERSDEVVGVSPEPEPPGPCAAKKGGGEAVDAGGDKVVWSGGEGKEDSLVVGGEGWKAAGKACVEALEGLEIDEKKVNNGGDADEEEDDDERPVLVEGYV